MIGTLFGIQGQEIFTSELCNPQSTTTSEPQDTGLAVLRAVDVAAIKIGRDLVDLQEK